MGRLARFSFFLNVLLLGLWLGSAGVFSPRSSGGRLPEGTNAARSGPVVVSRGVTNLVAVPFRWSQLEAADYRIFIKNLRKIECPEATIRAIVQRDADDAFSFQRRQLHLSPEDPGRWSSVAEARLLASLFGDPLPADADVVAARGETEGGKPAAWPVKPGPVEMPMLFKAADWDQMNLDGQQRQVVAQLQQKFMQEIGGTNQDPNDPNYLARWRKYEPEIEQEFRYRLGSQTYLRLWSQIARRTGN